jgi:hypothetical protein
LNSFSTIFQILRVHYVRIGAIWVMEGDKDQKEDKNPDKTEPPVCPFAELEQKLRELWKQTLAQNKRYWLMRNLVRDGAKQIPSKWGLPIFIFECSIDEEQRLL